MTIEDAIYSRLSGYASLTALVGTAIYPVRRGQSTKSNPPYVTFQLISDVPLYAMGVTVNVARPLYQFNCWATTPQLATDVAAQVRAAIEGQYRQVWGGESGVTIQGCHIKDVQDVFDDETGWFGRMVEAEVNHET